MCVGQRKPIRDVINCNGFFVHTSKRIPLKRFGCIIKLANCCFFSLNREINHFVMEMVFKIDWLFVIVPFVEAYFV